MTTPSGHSQLQINDQKQARIITLRKPSNRLNGRSQIPYNNADIDFPDTLSSEKRLNMPTEFLDLKVGRVAPEFSMSKQSMISSMGKDH
jgi:hypothetical protein